MGSKDINEFAGGEFADIRSGRRYPDRQLTQTQLEETHVVKTEVKTEASVKAEGATPVKTEVKTEVKNEPKPEGSEDSAREASAEATPADGEPPAEDGTPTHPPIHEAETVPGEPSEVALVMKRPAAKAPKTKAAAKTPAKVPKAKGAAKAQTDCVVTSGPSTVEIRTEVKPAFLLNYFAHL